MTSSPIMSSIPLAPGPVWPSSDGLSSTPVSPPNVPSSSAPDRPSGTSLEFELDVPFEADALRFDAVDPLLFEKRPEGSSSRACPNALTSSPLTPANAPCVPSSLN